jgi:hypothetical protein
MVFLVIFGTFTLVFGMFLSLLYGSVWLMKKIAGY